MTSFQIAISPSRRAAGRFISRVRRSLQRALIQGETGGLNQTRIAEAIGVHRSVISRELNGRQDITLGRVAELAWAMGYEIDFDLIQPVQSTGTNTPVIQAGSSGTLEFRRQNVETCSTPNFNQPLEFVM
jgi:predicted XRE-type DNA-binding protein